MSARCGCGLNSGAGAINSPSRNPRRKWSLEFTPPLTSSARLACPRRNPSRPPGRFASGVSAQRRFLISRNLASSVSTIEIADLPPRMGNLLKNSVGFKSRDEVIAAITSGSFILDRETCYFRHNPDEPFTHLRNCGAFTFHQIRAWAGSGRFMPRFCFSSGSSPVRIDRWICAIPATPK